MNALTKAGETLEVVQEKCPCQCHNAIHGAEFIRKYPHERLCQGACTGYVTRSWDGLPKGSLKGALAHAMGLRVVSASDFKMAQKVLGMLLGSLKTQRDISHDQ